MKIISWNVNGIRACVNKGFIDFLDSEKPDIICLQEIKAMEDQFPAELIERKEHFYIHSAKKRGYSGVCIISKKKPENIWYGLGISEFDDEGRCLIAEYKNFILFNCYFPNGQRDHGRVPYKLSFSDAVVKKAKALKKKTGKEVIIAGDYNTAHTEMDLANPKSNKNSTGFLPIEREWMDKFFKNGFVDTFRLFTPMEENGHYTWWTYRSNCRAKNVGWRIDYFCVTKEFSKKIKKSYHLPLVLGSDHCPLAIEF